jgi:AMP deaminase
MLNTVFQSMAGMRPSLVGVGVGFASDNWCTLRSKHEWDSLADWLVDNQLFSPHVRWLIQIPRLFGVYKASGEANIESFGDMIASMCFSLAVNLSLTLSLALALSYSHNTPLCTDIFDPLFAVSHDPSSNAKLHKLLDYVVGFDCVDDESKPEGRLYQDIPRPDQWTSNKNPPYTYYMYYLYANIYQLNCFRQSRGLSM